MKSKVFVIALLILIAFTAGAGVAIYRIVNWDNKDAAFSNGSWMGHHLSNLGEEKLLTARIAVAALFALDPSEAIYLVASTDDEGNPLSSKNDYVITGNASMLDACYWSITLYGPDYFLVPNEPDIFSYNMANLQYTADSSFQISVSSEPVQGDWLPSGNEKQFYLAMRLYHASPQMVENIEKTALPVIRRVK